MDLFGQVTRGVYWMLKPFVKAAVKQAYYDGTEEAVQEIKSELFNGPANDLVVGVDPETETIDVTPEEVLQIVYEPVRPATKATRQKKARAAK